MTTYTLENTLKNGVEIFALDVQADFSHTQEILDQNEYTQNIDSEYAYNERVTNDFVGTYKVKVARTEDHERFVDMLQQEKRQMRRTLRDAKDVYVEKYYSRGLMSRDEIIAKIDETNEKIENHKMIKFRTPDLNEWKTGKYNESEKRQMKLGKTLLKAGFSQTVIDFYSLQTKTEKDVFVTISDLPQHIAGMSRLAEVGAFDGMNGTSCQDTRWGGRYPIALGGALHDDKLFVGMMHYSHDDIEDMQDKLIARTVFRYITIKGIPTLIATYYYGQNDTKDMLHNALKQLSEVEVYSKDARMSDWSRGVETITEDANGSFEMNTCIEVHIEETIEEDVEVECPMCSGTGDYEVYSHGGYHSVSCPACGGDGNVTTSIYIDVDEYIEIEDEVSITPYEEGYMHNSHCVRMDVNVTLIDEMRLKHLTEKAENEINSL